MNITLDKVVDVIQRTYPYPWAKSRQLVFDWLVWYIKHGFSICVTEDNSSVDGLLLLRPVMEVEDGLDDKKFDHEGTVIFVDFCYAAHKRAMRGLVTAAIQRFGRRQTLAWQRRGELHYWPAHCFVRHVLEEKHYVQS